MPLRDMGSLSCSLEPVRSAISSWKLATRSRAVLPSKSTRSRVRLNSRRISSHASDAAWRSQCSKCDDWDLTIRTCEAMTASAEEMIRLGFQTECLAGQIEGPDLAPPIGQRFAGAHGAADNLVELADRIASR